MAIRKDLKYETCKTEIPYIFTGASDIDDALEKAINAIRDARSFREYSKATGIDVVRTDISLQLAAFCFACGAVACLLVLWCLEVI